MQLFELFGSISVDSTQATNNLTNFNSSAGSSVVSMGKLSTGAIAVGSAVATAGIAIGALAVGVGALATSFADDLQGSLNQVQASTGKTKQEMNELETAMVNIYNNNFGESFEDIGNVMSRVTQTIGGTAEEIQKVTENAYLMNDVFEIDTEGSINAVNTLMKNFGINSEEAFNLISIGAQEGANKNGDLIDTLNEYSPAFSNLGLSAENFTSVLIAGAESGAFSIDKIGDAVKEFEIRAQDFSDSTHEAFTELGLDSTKLRKSFAEGGDVGAESFQLVIDKLMKMEDPVRQNLVGVQLFGSMFEDLGPKGISALQDISNEVVYTEDALQQINSVKYDTFGEAMEGIKRNLETSILLPMGEAILPILGKFTDFINDNMPIIKKAISNTFNYLTDNVFPPFTNIITLINDKALPILMDTFNEVFPEIKETVKEVLKIIVEDFLPPMITILEYIYTTILPKLADNFKVYFPRMLTVVSITVKAISEALKAFVNNLKSTVNFLGNMASGEYKKAFINMKDIATTNFNAITETAEYSAKKLMERYEKETKKTEPIEDNIESLTDKISNIFSSSFEDEEPKKKAYGHGEKIGKQIAKGVEKAIPKVEKAIEKTEKVLEKNGEKMVKLMESSHNKIDQTIDKFYNNKTKVEQKALDKDYKQKEEHYKKLNKLANEEVDKQIKKLQITYNKTLREIDEQTRKRIANIDEQTSKEVQAIEKQIQAIDEKTEQEEKELEEQVFLNDLANDQKEIMNLNHEREQKLLKAKSSEEKQEIENEYSKKIQEISEEMQEKVNEKAREKELERREEQKRHLEKKIENIIDSNEEEKAEIEKQAELKRGQAQLDLDMYTAHYEQIRLEADNKYDIMLSDLEEWHLSESEKIAAENEAKKKKLKTFYGNLEEQYKTHFETMLEKQQQGYTEIGKDVDIQNKGIVETIDGYTGDWQSKGVAFMNNLISGLNSKKADLQRVVDEIMALMQKAQSTSIRPTSAMNKISTVSNSVFAKESSINKIEEVKELNDKKQSEYNFYEKPSQTNTTVNINNPTIVGDNAGEAIGNSVVNTLESKGVA